MYMIRFVAYNSYSGVWKRALNPDFYSFADGEFSNPRFFTRVYSITYRVDRP